MATVEAGEGGVRAAMLSCWGDREGNEFERKEWQRNVWRINVGSKQ